MENTHSGKRRFIAAIGSAWIAGALLSGGCLFKHEPKFSELPDPYAPVVANSGGTAPEGTAPVNSGSEHVVPVTAPAKPAEAPSAPSSDILGQDVIRIGETLDIVYSDAPNGLQPAHEKVRDDGTITLMFDKSFKAAGKTQGQLAREIRAAYVPDFFKQLTVSVTRPEIRRFIYIDGEVKAPSKQEYTGPITLTQVIAAVGGFTDFARKGAIKLYRSNGKIEIFDYSKIMKHPKLDPEVNPGDRILVQRSWL